MVEVSRTRFKHGLCSVRTKAAIAYMRDVSRSLVESGVEA